jgi:hypothetical protein
MGIVRTLRRRAGRIVKTTWFNLEILGHRRTRDRATRRWIAENLAALDGRPGRA